MFITRNSSCCNGVSVDLLTGTASVLYTNGAVYNYTNVSRRAIVKLLLEDTISLGSWVNKYCVAYDSKCADNFDANPLTLQSAV